MSITINELFSILSLLVVAVIIFFVASAICFIPKMPARCCIK